MDDEQQEFRRFTRRAGRRTLMHWRAQAMAALVKLERRATLAFRAVLGGTGSHEARLRWDILVARCVFYLQRVDRALASL